jgi:hypothetical protein
VVCKVLPNLPIRQIRPLHEQQLLGVLGTPDPPGVWVLDEVLTHNTTQVTLLSIYVKSIMIIITLSAVCSSFVTLAGYCFFFLLSCKRQLRA